MGGSVACTSFRVIFPLALLTFVSSTFFWYGSTFGTDSGIGPLQNVGSQDFFWADIKPAESLVWHKCYKPLIRECARLLVPLNHLNHTRGSTDHATIALIRKASRFTLLAHPNDTSKPHPRYRGPILFNPGGPGGSGVDFIGRVGDIMAQILGEEFDLVGFDPRGVGRSTPKIRFFDALEKGEREVWAGSNVDIIRGGLSDPNLGVEGEKGQSIERAWARTVTTNRLAGERGDGWLGNTNTEQTARDMLSIVKAHGKEKLMYWGFSYGTVLGATFAALFPDKFERLVLDGVVDAENYYAAFWDNNILDTSSTMNHFFEMCHAAGPESCAFWASSPELISANLTRIYQNLIREPIPIRTPTSYGVLDYSRVRSTIFSSLYFPWAQWPSIAMALADLGSSSRDPMKMWNLSNTLTFKCPRCSPPKVKESQLEKHFRSYSAEGNEATFGIMCSDGMDIFPDFASVKRFFVDFSSKREWADIWASHSIACTGWPKTQKGFQGPVRGKTDFPILLIGNTADPVTPLVHAKTTSKRFPGSRVLTQDSPGHCSISGPSVCTQSFIRDYFVSGKLPPEGTVCPVISSPFPKASTLHDATKGGDRSDIEAVFIHEQERLMRDAVEKLSEVWRTSDRSFLRGPSLGIL